MNIRRLILILNFVLCFIQSANATGQEPDLLIIKSDTFYLFSNPLETYFDFKNNRIINGIEINGTSTGCWRGYIATWKIENDSLFLIKIIREPEFGKFIVINLKEEFGKDKVFAEWYTGMLYSPRGNRLQYVHMDYASIYEKEEYYKIWNGKIKSTESKNNLLYDKSLLYPGERFLIDTLSKIIKSKLNTIILKEISDSSSCFLHVQFNKSGRIEKLSLGMPRDENTLFGKSILKAANDELNKLPSLMQVTHNCYQPPHFELWFHAYCIKYPWDKEYGCRK
jgi:hypothetical protein